MLEESRRRILERLADGDSVLDVGGWGKPFARADWVIDLMPHDSRGLYGYDEGSRETERFTAGTWVQRDICTREPWPFADRQFDFAVCSHTLEDVRDPLWVCSELARVAKAGYVEVPSREEEQCYGIQGPWVGWGHHHWLIDPDGETGLAFLFKPHILHGPPEFSFPPEHHAGMSATDKVTFVWWESDLPVRERFLFAPGELDEDLRSFVSARGVSRADAEAPRRRRGLRR